MTDKPAIGWGAPSTLTGTDTGRNGFLPPYWRLHMGRRRGAWAPGRLGTSERRDLGGARETRSATCHVPSVKCHASCARCQVLCAKCQVLCAKCHVSSVMCQVSCAMVPEGP